MAMTTIERSIAPLFVPADRPERFVKAASSAADAIILDLEDAVAADAKSSARASLNTCFTDKPVIVRINAAGTAWHANDVQTMRSLRPAAVMLPKAEDVAAIAALAREFPIVALIETARGIAVARDIARIAGVLRLAFGSVDYAVDLGCDHVREALAPARGELVLAARLAGIAAPLDGVTTDIADTALARKDAAHARAIGFSGKLTIHPAQVADVLSAFAPGEADLDWARRVIASGDGAAAIDGAMVDAPVRARALAILRRSATRDAEATAD